MSLPFIQPAATFDLSSNFTSSAFNIPHRKDGGAIQLSWSNSDSATGVAGLEISNDGTNWVPWTGLHTTLSTPVDEINITVGSDLQVWEVKHWTARFVRLTYAANSTTTGTATIIISSNRA